MGSAPSTATGRSSAASDLPVVTEFPLLGDVSVSFSSRSATSTRSGLTDNASQLSLHDRMMDASRFVLCPNEDCIDELFTCVRGYTELEGPNSLNVATCYYWLGVAMESLGNFVEAEQFLLLCQDIRCAVLSAYHVDLDTLYTKLGGLYYRSLSFSQAEKFFRKALDIRISNDGPDHSSVAATCYLLGHTNMHCSKLDAALSYFEQSLTIKLMQLKAGRESYEDVGQTLECMGNLSKELGDDLDASMYYEFALTMYKKHPGRIDELGVNRVEARIRELGTQTLACATKSTCDSDADDSGRAITLDSPTSVISTSVTCQGQSRGGRGGIAAVKEHLSNWLNEETRTTSRV